MKPRWPRLATGLASIVLVQSVAGCGLAAETTDATLPRPDGPVLDNADILPAATEATLDKRLRDYVATSGNALVVVSVTSLEGKTIEKYANDLFNGWGIGDAKTDRGILLLVAPYERKLRIEVGCGLEAVVTNEEAGEVIREDITPHYRKGDLAGGTIAGVDALVEALAEPPMSGPPNSPLCKANNKKAA